MTQPHLAARLLPEHQRHWVGSRSLIGSDRTEIVEHGRRVSEATKINHFWHTLQHKGLIDQVTFKARP